ncbi:MAG: glutamate--tRNA ligase family protein [Candidatus Kaiserbacteria bacterium]|nr:glutamate--tRNA ligase family protein [Candidatus Kaiserbacteria bacterium]
MTAIITRIAPSPTGYLHFGLARTALFSYLFTRKAGGEFILRIEDTDAVRNKPEYEADIFEELAWLGLNADHRFRQSEHRARHTECLRILIEKNLAYESEEPAKDDPSKIARVVRLKNPGETVVFTDLIRGEISFDTTELGDFVIARSIDDPLYHLAVVVDDEDENVTHIIRGEDHISNTPRHILLQRALGFRTPAYAHIPLILMSDRSKMSKRKHESSVKHYREQGILPEALINYLALLGWNPGGEREFYTLSELVEIFDLSRVQKGGAVFDEVKLFSVNQHWMRTLSVDDFIIRGNLVAHDAEKLRQIVPLLKERAHTFAEARAMLSDELACLFTVPAIDRNLLLAKELSDRPGMTKAALESLSEALKSLPEGVSSEIAKEALMPLADAEEAKGKGGRGAVLWPLRYALSGQERSPDPFTLVSILGPREALSRAQKAVGILEG